MVRRTIKIRSLLLLITLISYGCYFDNEEDLYPNLGNCDTTNVTYALTIAPIIQFSCYSCHSTAQAPVSGNNIDLEGHTHLTGYITLHQQLFMDAIRHTGSAVPMPINGGSLTSCDIKRIQAWMNAGMPNN